MSVVTSANNPALSPVNAYFKKVPLKRLIAKTVYYQLGYKETLENNNGRSFTWTLPGTQAADTTALVGGAPVAPSPVTSQGITATLQEYGRAYAAGSFLGNTSIINAEKMLEEQAEQGGAYSVDGVIRNVVFGNQTFGVTQYGANFKTSLGAVTSSDVFTLADVRRMHGILENNNVPSFKDGKYAVVCSVAQSFDLTNSSAGGGFLGLAQQNPEGISDIKAAFKVQDDGKLPVVGDYAGAVVFKTSLNPVLNGAGNGGINLHQAAAWGDASLGVVDLDAERFKIFRKDAKDSGTWDVLEMVSIALGYKFGFAAQNLSADSTTAANQRVITLASAISLF